MKPDPKQATSLRQLAKGVGRSHQVAARWVAHPKWDQSRTPPWDIAKAKTWAARTLPPNPAERWDGADADDVRPEPQFDAGGSSIEALKRSPMSAAKLKLTIGRAQMIELQRQILSGDYIPKKDVEEGLVRRVYATRAAFEAIPRTIAGRLVGLDEVAIEEALLEAIDSVCLQMSRMTVLPAVPKDHDMEVDEA